MFDIGWSELLLLAVVAIIVVGPKDLPSMLRKLGQMISKLRRMADSFRAQFDEAIRESEFEEINRTVKDLTTAHPVKNFLSPPDDNADPFSPEDENKIGDFPVDDKTGEDKRARPKSLTEDIPPKVKEAEAGE